VAVTSTLKGPAVVEPDMAWPTLDERAPSADPLSRWVLAGLGAFFLTLTFVQAPGLIVDDTKLPVLTAPLAWMRSALHLWSQSVASGSVQDEKFGYLFPMAPFFEVTHVLHVPVWCAERIWLALLLTVGAWGIVRVAEALGIGKPWARVLGGITYCVAPIVVTWAATSGTLLAVVLMPWVLRPLIVGARTGSPRRAAARSGIAVALMGGINATVILATLPVGVVWLLTRAGGRRRRSLAFWWVVSLVLACLWWVVPTVLQGKYGYNYLPYTESSLTTTSTASAFEALRGASYWTDYFDLGGPLIPGVFTLLTSAAAIVATAMVTALGLCGLARRIPERLFLVACLVVGVVIIAIGYSGSLAGPFSHHVQVLLQGHLAPLRSVTKFSPDVALPLALGVTWLVSSVSTDRLRTHPQDWTTLRARVAARSPDLLLPVTLAVARLSWSFSFDRAGDQSLQGKAVPGSRAQRWPDVLLPVALVADRLASMVPLGWRRRIPRRRPRQLQRNLWRMLVGLLAVVAVAVAAVPFWQGDIYPPGGFAAIPHYWTQASDWLDAHQGNQTTLLVPGAAFADYTWGNPLDEPLSALTSTSVTSDSIVPPGSNGNTVMLSTVDDAISTGTAQPGLAQYLSRSGIDYVVERNDLNQTLTGAPPPALVHQVLSETPGLTEVASFGSYIPASQVAHGTLPAYDSSSSVHLRSVEIFRVGPSVSEVQTFSTSSPLIVSGSSGSLLPLAGVGALNGRPAVLAKDPDTPGVASAPGATLAVTDGNQRRADTFGRIYDVDSYLLGPGQHPDGSNPGVPLNYQVVSGSGTQTVSAPIGASSDSATSVGSTALYNEPTQGPDAAFDANPLTAWVASADNNSVGQSISITFDHKIPLSSIAITPLDDATIRPSISRVTLTTDAGAVQRKIPIRNTPVKVTVAPGATRHLTITISDVRAPPTQSFLGPLGAGITGVAIPGVSFQPAMELPTDDVTSFSGGDSRAVMVDIDAPVTNPNLDFLDPTNHMEPIPRRVVLPRAIAATISGNAVPTPGPGLDNLVAFFATPSDQTLQISASSWMGDLPRFRPENLVQQSSSPWIAGVGDSDPTLTLHWNGPRSVNSLSLGLAANAGRPTEVVVSSPFGARQVRVPRHGGVITFAPMTTNTLTVKFVGVITQITADPITGLPFNLPVGLRSIGVPALQATTPKAVPSTTSMSLPCGSGPPVAIDGQTVPTSVTGTVGDLIDLAPMSIQACTGTGLDLPAGMQVISFPSGSAFLVTGLLAASTGATRADTGHRTARVVSWNPQRRTLALDAGPATYVQVAQNYNRGWVASLNGRTLTPMRLDGWEQGWLVPAGAAGTMTMTFAPDHSFRLALLLGALLLVLLAVLALAGPHRSSLKPVGPRKKLRGWVLLAAAALIALSVGGWVAVALVPLLLVAWRWGSTPVAVGAGVAFLAAGVIVALNPNTVPELHLGAFGAAAQFASVVALCALLSAVVVGEQRQRVDKPPRAKPPEPALAQEEGA
jgi:arabinofuranan 3-O-arabinosyltransferase